VRLEKISVAVLATGVALGAVAIGLAPARALRSGDDAPVAGVSLPAMSVAPAMTPQVAQDRCAAMAQTALKNVRIQKTELIDGGVFQLPGGDAMMTSRGASTTESGKVTDLPPFCRIVGTIEKEINFEVWLPLEWNGKFHGVGIGGFAGTITYVGSHKSLPGLSDALKRGYAAVATDTGHELDRGDQYGAAWSFGQPERVRNFLLEGTHKAAVVAKQIVSSFYGRSPTFSTFAGCSGGGHQALLEATRYPEDYDAIVAFAPTNPQLAWAFLFNASLASHRTPEAILSPKDVQVTWDAIFKKCDANDGLTDNSIEDPRRCDFKPAQLLCKPGQTSGCLTAPQVKGLEVYYRPLRNAKGGTHFPGPGENYFAGQAPGRGPSTIVHSGAEVTPFETGFGRFYTQKPNWDWRSFTPQLVDKIVAATHDTEWTSNFDAFRKRGGKLLIVQGWADWGITPETTIAFYKKALGIELGRNVSSATPPYDASSFMRLVMAPNTDHCSVGQYGGSDFDALTAVDKWRDTGVAPARIISERLMAGKKVRTRPLCPFPQEAIYKGTGDIDDARNFECKVRTIGRTTR